MSDSPLIIEEDDEPIMYAWDPMAYVHFDQVIEKNKVLLSLCLCSNVLRQESFDGGIRITLNIH